jgi:hypothetical protein
MFSDNTVAMVYLLRFFLDGILEANKKEAVYIL